VVAAYVLFVNRPVMNKNVIIKMISVGFIIILIHTIFYILKSYSFNLGCFYELEYRVYKYEYLAMNVAVFLQ